jgi:hypothetical protein
LNSHLKTLPQICAMIKECIPLSAREKSIIQELEYFLVEANPLY